MSRKGGSSTAVGGQGGIEVDIEEDDAFVDIYGDATDASFASAPATGSTTTATIISRSLENHAAAPATIYTEPTKKALGASIISPDTPQDALVDFSADPLSPATAAPLSAAGSAASPSVASHAKGGLADDAVVEMLDLEVDDALLQSATLAIYLANLTWWTSDTMLEQACASHDLKSGLTEVLFLDHRGNGKSKGMAYLSFKTTLLAAKAKRLFEQTQRLPQPPRVTFVPEQEIGHPFSAHDAAQAIDRAAPHHAPYHHPHPHQPPHAYHNHHHHASAASGGAAASPGGPYGHSMPHAYQGSSYRPRGQYVPRPQYNGGRGGYHHGYQQHGYPSGAAISNGHVAAAAAGSGTGGYQGDRKREYGQMYATQQQPQAGHGHNTGRQVRPRYQPY